MSIRRLFIGTTSKNDNGWMMNSCGCSTLDNEDYVITTNYLKADEVPEDCMDAKTFSQLCAGLLNAFYNEIDVSKLQPEEVILMGLTPEEKNIPHPSNTEIPF